MDYESKQPFLAPNSHSFTPTPVPGDSLILNAASTHYYEKHSATSTAVGRSAALVTSSDRWSKRERELRR